MTDEHRKLFAEEFNKLHPSAPLSDLDGPIPDTTPTVPSTSPTQAREVSQEALQAAETLMARIRYWYGLRPDYMAKETVDGILPIVQDAINAALTVQRASILNLLQEVADSAAFEAWPYTYMIDLIQQKIPDTKGTL